MARTYDITRRNLTKQRKDRRDKQTRTTNKHLNTKIFPRSYTVFCEIHTEPIRVNRQHETTTQKRDEMGMDNRSKFGVQQDKTRTNITSLFGTLQRQQRKYCHNRRRQASRYLNDAEKKYSIGEQELLAVIWGLERFRFHLYGKQVQLFSDHQALEPLLKRNKQINNTVRLTRWLDRLNHFDICLKPTAGEEIKFTDYISRNPTENPEPEENYEEEFVINAIAQLATVNARIGRIFDQSEDATTASEANIRDTRSLIDTRRYQTNKSHIDSNYRIQQHSSDTDCLKLNNNENNTRFFRTDGQLRHHWGADDDIMAIINARDKSSETAELVRRRVQLARPGVMRPHCNKNLGREIYIPRRPEEGEKR